MIPRTSPALISRSISFKISLPPKSKEIFSQDNKTAGCVIINCIDDLQSKNQKKRAALTALFLEGRNNFTTMEMVVIPTDCIRGAR